jgi:hypothetical protein
VIKLRSGVILPLVFTPRIPGGFGDTDDSGLAGISVPPENFIVARVSPDNLTPDQPEPASPDKVWPEALKK